MSVLDYQAASTLTHLHECGYSKLPLQSYEAASLYQDCII